MKKKKNIIPADQFQDRIKQTLVSNSVPLYDWMSDLGLNHTELVVYAHVFNILKSEPLKERLIETSDICNITKSSASNAWSVIDSICKRGLLWKRVVGRGRGSKTYYSLYPPVNMEE